MSLNADFGQPPLCMCRVGGLATCLAHPPWTGITRWPGVDQPSLVPPALSDSDVERIAKRVAELIKGGQ